MSSTHPPVRPRLGPFLQSVVKVLTVSDSPDYGQPWQTHGPSSSAGSGAVIQTDKGPRVLTNSHCVEDHVYVEVGRYGRARKFPAQVEALGHECDLALLRIEDPAFFQGIRPIQLGGLPDLGDRVSVCGYPIGGERVSVSQGVVSRIEMVQYAQSQRFLLAVQIDAAINFGNSGGPVLRDGELVGVAFQALEEAQQIGYMVAPPVIEHFLHDIAKAREPRFPSLDIVAQPLESDAHRRALRLPIESDTGMLIIRVAYGGSAWGVVREGDVLLEVDHVPIACDGTVPLRDGEVVDFSYAISRRHVGDVVTLKLWRDGQELTETVKLQAPCYLVSQDRFDVPPTYFIFGGLVLAPLTRNFLKTYEDPWWQHAPRELVTLYEKGVPTQDLREPVVLQKVLADRVNQGYHELEGVWIRRVNGEAIRSLSHMITVVERSTAQFIQFEANDGRRVVLEREKAIERGPKILQRFGVPDDRCLPDPQDASSSQ